MKDFDEFHDGSFEGLWIDGKTVHVFLATDEHEQFVFVAGVVAEVMVDGVKSGSVIFEVLVRNADEVVTEDIKTLYQLRDGTAGESRAVSLLEKARLLGWKFLEINPSYGAACLVLSSSIELLRREDWLSQRQPIRLPA